MGKGGRDGLRVSEMAAVTMWPAPFCMAGVRMGKLGTEGDQMAGLATLLAPSWGITRGEATGCEGTSQRVREEPGTAWPVMSWEGDRGDREMSGRQQQPCALGWDPSPDLS